MEEVEIHRPSPVSHALKSGLYLGIINAIVVILLYVVDPTLLASMWLGLAIIVINFSLVIYFGIQYRNEVGGYLSYGPSFMHGLVTLIVAGLIGTIFQVLLYTVIAPELPEILVQSSIENASSMMKGMGVDDAQIDAQMEEVEKSTAERFTISGLFLGFLWGIIVYAIIALITGLIVKKNDPVETI